MQRVTRHNRVTRMPLSLVFLSFVKAGEDKTLVEKKGLRFLNSNRGAKTEAKNKGKKRSRCVTLGTITQTALGRTAKKHTLKLSSLQRENLNAKRLLHLSALCLLQQPHKKSLTSDRRLPSGFLNTSLQKAKAAFSIQTSKPQEQA